MNSSQAHRNCSRGAASQRMLRPSVSVRLGGDAGRIETGCRDRIRTGNLRGMNPVSYLCSTLLRNGWSVMVRRRRSSLTRRGTGGRSLWPSEDVRSKKMTGNPCQSLHIKDSLRRHNEPLVHRLRRDAKRTGQGTSTFCPIFSGLKGHMHFVSISHARF